MHLSEIWRDIETMKWLKGFMLTVLACCLLCGCSNDDYVYSRNSKYTYGTYKDDGITEIYNLVGSKTSYGITDYSNGFTPDKSDSYTVIVSETACGGVVAYGNISGNHLDGIYVYSPDKKDREDVREHATEELKNQ